jgi:hypothetical protein
MSSFTRKHTLLLVLLLLLICSMLISCSQGSNQGSSQVNSSNISVESTSTSEPSPTAAICTACVIIDTPSLTKLTPSQQGGELYQLTFVITNHGMAPLNNVQVSMSMDGHTDAATFSYNHSIGNGATIGVHEQATYHIGDADESKSDFSMTLPNPPPASVHVAIKLQADRRPVTSWDGQVTVPA